MLIHLEHPKIQFITHRALCACVRACMRACIRTVQRLRVGQVFLELLVQVFTDSDVLEHSLQFGRVLEAARLLRDKNRARFSLRCGNLTADVFHAV